MKIESLEAIPITASFKSTFRFGTTDRSTSPNVVVVIRTDEGVAGYGEACPVPAFTSETQKSIVELIEDRVAPVLVGKRPENRRALLADISRFLKFAPFTVAAIDTALLDLVGRALDVPVHTLLGGAYRDFTEAHGSVGWSKDSAEMVEIAVEQSRTYRWLKTYAGRDDVNADLDRLEAVRDAVDADVKLFVDINGMWSASDLLYALPRIKDIGVTMLEQPLPPKSTALAREIVGGQIDICADESVRTVADTARVVREGGATVINLGHSKLGGPSAAMDAAKIADANGVGLMVGSVVEMGIATAMGLHVAAALPRLTHPSYLMGPLKYRQQITEQQIEVTDGCIAIPNGPGLGFTIDETKLRQLDARA